MNSIFSILSHLAILSALLFPLPLPSQALTECTPPINQFYIYLPFITAPGTSPNSAPYTPNCPSPANATITSSLSAVLTWNGGDPDNDSVTYDIYLEAGDNTPDVLVSNDQIALSYIPTTLSTSTTYFWQVIATDEHGTSTTGPVWSFTTENQAPLVPFNPAPVDGAADQSRGVRLSWSGGDPDNDPVTYDVYLAAGNSDPNILVSGNQSGTTYTPGTLNDDATYYWKVIATDPWGKSSESPVWRFAVKNQAPVITDPFPLGETYSLNVEVNLDWSASDPNGDAMTYDVYLELADNTPDILVASHITPTYFDPGALVANRDYYWQIVATDVYGAATSSPIWHFATTNSAYVVTGKISTGYYHTCGIDYSGAILCWGDNTYGQLGVDPSIAAESRIATLVSGFTSGSIEVAAGQHHTCALTGSGGVKCWGRNNYGQLGDGTTVSKSAPVDVLGLTSGVVHIATSANHTCAVLGSGGVKCWGDNYYGQLGNGTQTNQSSPVDVVGLANGIIQVTAGQGHTCALTRAGGVKCWGNNNAGQLGNGTQTKSATPVNVYSLSSGVSSISAGRDRSYAVINGRISWWGMHFTDHLSDTSFSTIPKDESSVMTGVDRTGVMSVDAGDAHTCVVMSSGNVKCWGKSDYSQVTFDYSYSANPIIISGLTSDTTLVSAGYQHTCVLNTSGVLKCWGANYDGQVGDGSGTSRRNSPAVVVNFTG